MWQSTQPALDHIPEDVLAPFVQRCADIKRTRCGVAVVRFSDAAGDKPVVMDAQPAYALVLDAGTPMGMGHARLASLHEGAIFRQNPDDALLAYLPERSFESVSGGWQLSGGRIRPGVHRVADDRAARHLCLTLLAAPAPQNALDEVFGNSIAKALLAHFLSTYCAAPTNPATGEPGLRLSPWQLRIAEETMLDRLDLRLPVSTVAERCGVSVVHFSRAFRHTTSETPHRWLMRRRLERACVLLVDTDDSISDIALSCGFSDQSHLTRTFSVLLDTTPAVWRQQRRRTPS
jgi:AraC-like DNA-binding protein